MSRTSQCFVLILILKYRFVSSEMESKIVGGDFANINNYPHAVFLEINCAPPTTCGGTILNQDIVLTAAHCLEDCSKGHIVYVHAGNENRKGRVVKKSRNFLIHENYNDYTLLNDIAMVSVEKHLPLGAGIKRAIIPRTYSRIPDNGTVAGWGVVNEQTNKSSVYLKAVTQPLIPRHKCMEGKYKVPVSAFCAGDTKKKLEQSNHPSYGDSGSGFLANKVYLIGVVSYKTTQYPGLVVYTNVSYYLSWIEKSSKKMHCL